MKNKVMYIVVISLVFALVCVSSGLINGRPEGYVGGYINSDGDMVGGHPSEQVMYQDGLKAGVYVIKNNAGCPVYYGENWREFAAMNGKGEYDGG
jgi:hypothetical protein